MLSGVRDAEAGEQALCLSRADGPDRGAGGAAARARARARRASMPGARSASSVRVSAAPSSPARRAQPRPLAQSRGPPSAASSSRRDLPGGLEVAGVEVASSSRTRASSAASVSSSCGEPVGPPGRPRCAASVGSPRCRAARPAKPVTNATRYGLSDASKTRSARDERSRLVDPALVDEDLGGVGRLDRRADDVSGSLCGDARLVVERGGRRPVAAVVRSHTEEAQHLRSSTARLRSRRTARAPAADASSPASPSSSLAAMSW